ncbi:MAG: hypothetical protein HYU33_01760, partial [Candidatus Omnitrophica bacterium]|nr:hypothetical protein [Candidatus Omnitrophota bacterium]
SVPIAVSGPQLGDSKSRQILGYLVDEFIIPVPKTSAEGTSPLPQPGTEIETAETPAASAVPRPIIYVGDNPEKEKKFFGLIGPSWRNRIIPVLVADWGRAGQAFVAAQLFAARVGQAAQQAGETFSAAAARLRGRLDVLTRRYDVQIKDLTVSPAATDALPKELEGLVMAWEEAAVGQGG